MMRSLWLHYPQDASRRRPRRSVPVGHATCSSRPWSRRARRAVALYLPRGAWHDYWTEERIEGGREIERAVDLETMPLHVRAGAIIPHAPVRQYVEQPSDEPLTVVVYPGADGAFVLYEDDGRTFAYRKGAFMRIAMAWDDRARRLSMRLAPGSRMLPPMTRPMRVRVAGSKEEKSVVFRQAHRRTLSVIVMRVLSALMPFRLAPSAMLRRTAAGGEMETVTSPERRRRPAPPCAITSDAARFSPAVPHRRLLGRGGMGEVYRADDLKLGVAGRPQVPAGSVARRAGRAGAVPQRGPRRSSGVASERLPRSMTSARPTTSTSCRWSTSTARISRRCSAGSAACQGTRPSSRRVSSEPASLPRTTSEFCTAI